MLPRLASRKAEGKGGLNLCCKDDSRLERSLLRPPSGRSKNAGAGRLVEGGPSGMQIQEFLSVFPSFEPPLI